MDNLNCASWSGWTTNSEFPKVITVVTLGYQSFMVSPDILAEILHAAATGKIQLIDKKYEDGKYQAVLKGALDVQVEHLDIMQDYEPEIKKLKARLAELEGKQHG